jgi:tRNA(Arg) A34 adenosine deaminase TadA
MDNEDQKYIKIAIELAKTGMLNGDGGPFGAIVVKDSKIIGKGNNCVTSTNDPTAHAEVIAIRDACKNISDFQLEGATIYTSCEPCPMCLGAIYWARPSRIVYACSRADAAAINFDDEYIYKEIALNLEDRSIPTDQLCRKEGLAIFKAWEESDNKKEY